MHQIKFNAVTEVASRIIVKHANSGRPLGPLEAMTLIDNLENHKALCEMLCSE